VSSDLVSGPDLGAGYLHQLSRDVDGSTTFTYHAQVGGRDASGPPLGPLDRFGFVRPLEPCMFGGPRCWHRRFLLPFEETPRVRQAYNRHRFVLETMLRQAYGGTPVAVERGLAELVARIAGPFDAEGIEWYVGGSTAVWLLGGEVMPRDIDVGTTRAGVDRLAELLKEYLIEPLAPTDWPRSGIVRGARAFVGTFHEGVRAEWSVPIEPRERMPFEEWSGRPGVARLSTASFQGRAIRVSRPEYALVRAAENGRAQPVGAIARVVRAIGPDLELWKALLSRSELDARQRETLERVLRAP
jgi:hypothetical protein